MGVSDDTSRVGNESPVGDRLDEETRAAKKGHDDAGERRTAHDEDPIRGVGVEPAGDGQEERSVREGGIGG